MNATLGGQRKSDLELIQKKSDSLKKNRNRSKMNVMENSAQLTSLKALDTIGFTGMSS